MINKLAKTLIAIMPFAMSILAISAAYCEEYPEFTGNYIKCAKGWCDLEKYQLNTMQLMHYEGNAMDLLSYAGFLPIPDDIIKVKESKPKILLFSGRSQSDPATTALVELARFPYNNDKISSLDDLDFTSPENRNKVMNYCKENVKYEMWTFKREIPLRFKPIEGKQGAYLYEPVEPLPDGIYVIDRGLPRANGHEGMATAPTRMDFLKIGSVQTALPFIVGEIKDSVITSSVPIHSDMGVDKNIPQNTQQKDPPKDIGTAVTDALFNAILNK